VRAHIAVSPLARAIILAGETTLEARPIASPTPLRAVTLRPLGAADLDGALAANDAVGWPDRRVLFDFYGARADSAMFVAEVDGAIAGTGGATIFPGAPPTGWVHGIVVRPEYQRLGLGARLTETSIEWLRTRAVSTVMLLATDAGRPVYERLGFAAGERYGSFGWPATGTDPGAVTEPLRAEHLPAVLTLDREATGEDRRGFISALAASGWVALRDGAVAGFHLACPWGGGPTVARDAASGLALLRLAPSVRRRASRGPGLPEANTAAVQYLAALGITAERYVTRMWLGTPPPWRAHMIFGVFNFGVA
jgi:GNAT superfamily N-acetyltransferase